MSTITFDFRHYYRKGERRESDQIAYQWDLGHVAEIYVPVNATYEIHYCFADFTETDDYAVESTTAAEDGGYKLTAHIPNKYFERSGELKVYVIGSDDNHVLTTYEGYISIRGRIKPDDYTDDDPENEATRILAEAREARDAAIEAAEQAEAAASQSAAQASIAAVYDATKTYAIGDYCLYDGQLYECTAEITTPEAWTAAHWTAATVGTELNDIKGDVSGLKEDITTAMDGISVQGQEITGNIIAFDKTGKTITQIAISDTSATSATITRCGKNIYPKYSSGSGNELSWVVASDGTITFTGTPTADTLLRMQNIRIPLANGNKFALSFANNLYDTNNRLSFFGVTSGGNIQLNLNSENATATWTAALTTVALTELRLRVPKDFNATGLTLKPMLVIGDAPAEFEEYNGQIFSVSVVDGVVQDTITMLDGVNTVWSSVGDITLTFDQAKNIKDYVDEQDENIKEYVDEQFANVSLFPSFYKYVQRTYSSGTQKYLYVYNKSGNKVVRWTLMNTPSSNSNSNTWQIGGVNGYDFDGNTLSNEVELAINGEFELAIKEHGAADYCGGINHGDENTDVFKLFIDGKQISDLTTLDENYHAFERIDAFEIATVNRCNTPSQDIITHQKIWTFENGKVRVHQTCKFLEQIQVDVMMVCMFKAVRSVYPYGIRQGSVEIENMTDATFTKKYTTGNNAYYLYYGDNATAKIYAKTDNNGSDRQSMLWIDNGSSFNKLYFGYWGYNDSANPVTVPANTIVTEETEYDVAFD